MGTPLFTDAEREAWQQQREAAAVPLPDDKVYRPETTNPYNESAARRVSAVSAAWTRERWNRIRNRPEDIVNVFLVAFHEKGSAALLWDDILIHGLGDRLAAADQPDTRRHLHTILSGLKGVPRSWATSATTRFFRGIGKQAKPPWSEKPGAGVLSKDHGWTTDASTWFIGLFYGYDFGKLFFSDDSPDAYGAEARDINEEGGNSFAATRQERDDAFFDSLLGLLEARGLGDMPEPTVKVAKPRKTKTWAPGDKVTSRNLRDLPEGAHLRWRVVQYESGWGRTGSWNAEHRSYELVFSNRPDTGKINIRPVMKGKAFGLRDMRSSALYSTGYRANEVETIYLGQWSGEVIDVEIDRSRNGWKPVKTRQVPMRTVRITDEDGKYVRTDVVEA